MRITSKGRIVVTTTISPEAREGLSKKGIPIGAAAELWNKHVDNIHEQNENMSMLQNNLVKMQAEISRLSRENFEMREKLKEAG